MVFVVLFLTIESNGEPVRKSRVSAESQQSLNKVSSECQKILSRVSADSQQILSRFSAEPVGESVGKCLDESLVKSEGESVDVSVAEAFSLL